MKLIVDHLWTKIAGKYPEATVEKATSYFVKGSWFAKSFRQGSWDGRKRLLNKRGAMSKFPTGLLSAVTAALDGIEWNYDLEDNRDFPSCPEPCYLLRDGDFVIDISTGPYDFQARALDAALQHSRGTIVMPTGAGKTILGAAIIASIKQPTLWLTHRSSLLYQTRQALSARLGSPVGLVGDGKEEIEDVTVCMVQTLNLSEGDKHSALKDFLSKVQVLIGDEIHHLASKSDLWYDNLSKINAPWRYGLTATPEFEGPGLKIIGQTGGEIFRITTNELIERGVLVPPRIWIDEVHTEVDKKAKWPTVYKQAVVCNLTRNRRIVEAAKLWGQQEGKPTIVLVRRIEHGQRLIDMFRRDGVTVDFVHGGLGETQRGLIISALKQRLIDCLVAQVEVLGEGVDLPWLQAAVNAVGQRGGGDASDGGEGETGRQTTQILGRILRRSTGKSHCDILDFADMGHKSLRQASEARLGTYLAQGHESRINRWSDYDESKP